MYEMSIRRLPVDDSSGVKQVIVQVPIMGSECYQLPEMLGVDASKIQWITPVQVSEQYTGIPAKGFTFCLQPNWTERGTAQVVTVVYNLQKVSSVMFGGPHKRIVTDNAALDAIIPVELGAAIERCTIAFLVQIEDTHEDVDNPGLLQSGRCIGTV